MSNLFRPIFPKQGATQWHCVVPYDLGFSFEILHRCIYLRDLHSYWMEYPVLKIAQLVPYEELELTRRRIEAWMLRRVSLEKGLAFIGHFEPSIEAAVPWRITSEGGLVSIDSALKRWGEATLMRAGLAEATKLRPVVNGQHH